MSPGKQYGLQSSLFKKLEPLATSALAVFAGPGVQMFIHSLAEPGRPGHPFVLAFVIHRNVVKPPALPMARILRVLWRF